VWGRRHRIAQGSGTIDDFDAAGDCGSHATGIRRLIFRDLSRSHQGTFKEVTL
jgi:hypothetical protein